MQIPKKTRLSLNLIGLKYSILMLVCLTGGVRAQTVTNRAISHLMASQELSINPRLQSLVDAVISETKQTQLTVSNAALVAWSAKTDELGVPPRLFEDAVVLVNVVGGNGTNEWILSYMCRGGVKGAAWGLPYYPPLCKPPVATYAEFATKPSDREIAEFIRASDFAYNALVPGMRVLTVAVFSRSVEIDRAILDSIPPEEKQRRYLEDQRCFLEKGRPNR